MAENEMPQSLSDTVSRLMESPEVAGILAALKGDDGRTEPTDAAAPALNIPPDIMAKLPSMISALSGMGIGAQPPAPQKSEAAPKKTGDKQRKALLTSLRPYLSPHRQSIIDNMLKLEGLTSLLSTVSIQNSDKTDSEGR